MNTDETDVEAKVRALSTEELLARYHQLVDKRLLDRSLFSTEHFEIELIEARLDEEI